MTKIIVDFSLSYYTNLWRELIGHVNLGEGFFHYEAFLRSLFGMLASAWLLPPFPLPRADEDPFCSDILQSSS